jgi:cold-inducible RNA-binding protein
MASKLFVGGLPYSSTDEELMAAFAAFGTVISASIVKDRDTGRSKGYGFVEYENDEDAKTACAKLDGSDLGGRRIGVSPAQPKTDRRF